MGRLMYWILEDNLVNSLIFCATITNHRGAILHLHKQERKRPTPVRRRLSRNHVVSGSARYFVQGESITWCTSDCSFRLFPNNWKLVWSTNENLIKFVSEEAMASSASFWLRYCTLFLAVPFQVGGLRMKVRSLVVHCNHSAFHRTSVIVVRWTDELLNSGYKMGVSIWDAVPYHSMDRWVLSGADVQAPWHGVLETVGLHWDEAQEVGCLRGQESCPLV